LEPLLVLHDRNTKFQLTIITPTNRAGGDASLHDGDSITDNESDMHRIEAHVGAHLGQHSPDTRWKFKKCFKTGNEKLRTGDVPDPRHPAVVLFVCEAPDRTNVDVSSNCMLFLTGGLMQDLRTARRR
jgi:hypothetical protein